MISSSNALSGLSAADISTLFGTNASSSSSSSSNSSATAQSTIKASVSVGVFTSSPSDPAKAIQAIVAQVQVERAPTATSGDGSARVLQVQTAYAAQLGSPNTLPVAQVTSDLQAVTQQMSDVVATFDNSTIEASGQKAVIQSVSLTVGNVTGTASDVASVTTGEEGQVIGGRLSTFDEFQYGSMEAQQNDNLPSTPPVTTSVGQGDTAGTPQTAHLALQVMVQVSNGTNGLLNAGCDWATALAQARQLASAFENNVLQPGAGVGSGFDFAEDYGNESNVRISGLVVSDSGNSGLPGSITDSGPVGGGGDTQLSGFMLSLGSS